MGRETADMSLTLCTFVDDRMQRTLERLASQLGIPLQIGHASTGDSSKGPRSDAVTARKSRKQSEPDASAEIGTKNVKDATEEVDSSDESDEVLGEGMGGRNLQEGRKKGSIATDEELLSADGNSVPETVSSSTPKEPQKQTELATSSNEARPTPSSLVNCLLGLQQPGFLSVEKHASEDPGDMCWFDVGLNASQRAALDFCLRAKEVALVHGPPGE